MRIGILGGGQLGRMLALAGLPLGFQFRFYDPSPGCPAAQVAPCIHGPWEDLEAIARFADGLDIVTYEFENVPAEAAVAASRSVPLHPGADILRVGSDRVLEREAFGAAGVAVANWRPVERAEELAPAAAEVGLPAVIKTRRLGYDGKGQWVVRTQDEIAGLAAAWQPQPCIIEELVPFDREVSIVAARDAKGHFVAWPLTENTHENGILRVSRAPADHSTALQVSAERSARAVMVAANYVGVFAIEFFVLGGKLIANEMAPRVHNSGHWTMNGAETSQFENHVRAIAGLPLGPTGAIGVSGMWNFIGAVPPLYTLLSMPGTHVHLYGKQPRPGRKLGHLNICVPDERRREAVIVQLTRMQKAASQR